MKKNLKSLSLKKSVISELNSQSAQGIKGGTRSVLTQEDTMCTSNAIGCQPTVNYTCG
ncbi:hypothetical protein C8N46_11083 [Kordia periserrulae]|uniref:Uncharacterized protein n=1 Tax=Kordia periserrulae TaxID=701523 RepID=A0A2T6BT87_9FLAO|nr:class I lanthipeptide [Kordia periserrulae]PTX59246.1 hypothetical protein C8N46_11083 [Kordia periserrulae]